MVHLHTPVRRPSLQWNITHLDHLYSTHLPSGLHNYVLCVGPGRDGVQGRVRTQAEDGRGGPEEPGTGSELFGTQPRKRREDDRGCQPPPQ